ncbi:hypothetical protein U3A58_18910 [Algoriphagus sp. C2-6-M1]|uniref:hypothetical protein n=1 Tax=Algoriphagus persicinus TaxID=3108754 RepID=UPI002B3FC5C7|nr:hypothetical protein [Algoriphagus sp. C2-6-M1]MEB2782468.1 hypothetical protein [Algoriphagus sp. C2-6-M1]
MMEVAKPRKKRSNLFIRFLLYIRVHFNLHESKEYKLETIEFITKNVEFKGANLRILIFSISVASVVLNVNSMSVVIKAMLI